MKGEPIDNIDVLIDDISSAIAFLRERSGGMYHGCLSPVYIEIKDGRAILNDYGYFLSRTYHQPDSGHLAPECIELTSVPDHKSDSYSFGLIINELYSARPAYDLKLSQLKVGFKVVKGELPPLATNMPEKHRELCHKCLARDPADRPVI